MIEPPSNSVHPLDLEGWRNWLESNHQRTEGVWLISHTRSSGLPRVDYADAVETALCYGWIDGRADKLDESRSMQWFSPRRKGSGWSRSNKERVARLTEEGRMRPAGIARVEEARADGSWTRLDAVEALEVPADLAAAFTRNPPAAEYFDAFPRSVKRAILEWISSARRPETRSRRVEETARLAAENIRANQRR